MALHIDNLPINIIFSHVVLDVYIHWNITLYGNFGELEFFF